MDDQPDHARRAVPDRLTAVDPDSLRRRLQRARGPRRAYQRLIARARRRASARRARRFRSAKRRASFPPPLMDRASPRPAARWPPRRSTAPPPPRPSRVVPDRFRGPNAEDRPALPAGRLRRSCARPAAASRRSWSSCRRLPSLYGFQLAMAEAYRDAFGLPASLGLFLDGLDAQGYHALVRPGHHRAAHDPHEVVLMEIEPRRQKTWPDFVITEHALGRARGRHRRGAARGPARSSTSATAGACRSGASTTA